MSCPSGRPDAPTLSAPALRAGQRSLRIGFLPLTDAAPLVVAEELGFFTAAGLRVTLSAESAWAALRDKLTYGALDAAHLLSPMAIAAALGLGGSPVRRLTVAAGLGQNGNTIVLSHALAELAGTFAPPLSAQIFAEAVRRRAAAGQAPPRLAVVYAHSSHNYLLRHWLAKGGLDPDRDVRLVVVPPPLVARALATDAIDGFCAGEPWGSHAIAQGAGRLALSTGDIWQNHPEKVLALAGEIAERDPEAAIAASVAVIRAARWLDDPANGAQAAWLLRDRALPEVDTGVIAQAFNGCVAGAPGEAPTPLAAPLRFLPATRPDAEGASWWFSAMRRWQHLPADAGTEPALAPWRNTIWSEAAALIGERPPTTTTPSPRFQEKDEA